MTNKRWKAIDSMYAIGIILVLIGHSHSSDWSKFDGTILNWGILFIYTFHMALFFFISGFLFINSKAIERSGYWRWFLQKAERLLVPYVFWSAIALVPKYYVEHNGFSGFSAGYLLRIMIEPRSGVWGHFWFLPVMFLSYLVFGIWKLYVNDNNEKKLIIAAAIVTVILYFLPINTDLFGLSDLKSMMPFFVFGIIVYRFVTNDHYIKLGIWRVAYCVVAITISVLIMRYAYSSRLIGFLVALIMISVCWIIGGYIQDNPLVSWLSNYNFTYYIFSWFFQAVTMALCDRLELGWIITFITMFSVGLAGPTFIILAYDKLSLLHRHFIRLILGVREKK